VFAHPVPVSFGAAVRDAAVEGLEAAGHQVDLLDLYAAGFDPVLSKEAHALHRSPPDTKPEIAGWVASLQAAGALVLVYPTWWGGQPAILKGWMDRVLVEGVAYTLQEGARRIRPRLGNIRRLAVVTTHGSGKWINALQGEPGKRVVLRGVRSLCHPLTRTRWVAMYGIDHAVEADRVAFLVRVRERLATL
jgi:putative NADPH-quinone reductase